MTKTFKQFKALGLGIKKGEKSIARNKDGECVFDLKQTLELPADFYDYQELEDGQLSENEIQELVSYRKMMKERVQQAALRGSKICSAYLEMVNSSPMAKYIDDMGDYSSDSDDIEPMY